MADTLNGACLCGAVEYEFAGAQMMASCHCTRCQRWTGGAENIVVLGPDAGFKITKGSDALKTYQEEGFGPRNFCGSCGSSLYGAGKGMVFVGAGTVKGDPGLRLAMHIQTSFKAPWDEIHGDAQQFPEWPPM